MLRLRGGAGWLASSSESGEDETVRAVDADSSDDESGTVHNSKYNLSAALLLDPAQYNVTDDVLDLFLRSPPRPTMRDGKPLCGVGLVLSNTKPYKVEYIHAGSPADLCSKIFVGDEIVLMDGRSLADLTNEQIRDIGLGFQDTILTLQLIPAEAQGRRVGAEGLWPARVQPQHASAARITLELVRGAEYVPDWAKPVPDDPGGDDSPAAMAWKERTREELRKELIGYPLADLGNWRKMKDKKTGATFYFDSLHKRVQFDKPLMVQVREKLKRLTNGTQLFDDALQRYQERREMKKRFFGTADAEAEEEEVVQQGLAGGVMEGEGKDLETGADAIMNELCQDLNATLLAAGCNVTAIPDSVADDVEPLFVDIFNAFLKEKGTREGELATIADLVTAVDAASKRAHREWGVLQKGEEEKEEEEEAAAATGRTRHARAQPVAPAAADERLGREIERVCREIDARVPPAVIDACFTVQSNSAPKTLLAHTAATASTSSSSLSAGTDTSDASPVFHLNDGSEEISRALRYLEERIEAIPPEKIEDRLAYRLFLDHMRTPENFGLDGGVTLDEGVARECTADVAQEGRPRWWRYAR